MRKKKAVAAIPEEDNSTPLPTPDNPEPVHGTPKLAIVNPINGETVRLFGFVQGYCEIEDPAKLELLVQSVEDGRYYLQRKAEVRVEGTTWSAYCQFGDIAVPGNQYRIIAVYGSTLEQQVFTEIPAGLIQSNAVTVQRVV